MWKGFILVMACVLLNGCVQYRWDKLYASENDRTIQLTSCKAKALKDLPPDNVIQTSNVTRKDKDGKKYTDKTYSTDDANRYNRDILIDDCMYQHGWTKTEVHN